MSAMTNFPVLCVARGIAVPTHHFAISIGAQVTDYFPVFAVLANTAKAGHALSRADLGEVLFRAVDEAAPRVFVVTLLTDFVGCDLLFLASWHDF